MNKISLSIIIPHFNDFASLQKILELNYPDDVEVILVDDNSDNFHSEFKYPKNISNFMLKHNNSGNKGAGACRNIGLKIARGSWVTFLDSDDIFLDNYYELLSRYFEENYEVVFFTPTSVDQKNGDIADRHVKYERMINNYLNNPNLSNELRLKFDFDAPWSKLIKRSFLINNDILFDETLSANDTMASVKIGYKMKLFTVTKESFYIITKRDGSLTTLKSKALFDIRFGVRVRKYDFLKKNLSKKELKKYSLPEISQGLLITAYLKGYGLDEVLKYYRIMKKNKMQIFSLSLFNPLRYIKLTSGLFRNN